MSTPALGGTVAGSRPSLAMAKAKCIRYARSGGRSVSAIVTIAPAFVRAARNLLVLALKGSTRVSGLLLLGKWDTHTGPLNGIGLLLRKRRTAVALIDGHHLVFS